MTPTAQPGTWWVQVEAELVLHIVCLCGQVLRTDGNLVDRHGTMRQTVECITCKSRFKAHLEDWEGLVPPPPTSSPAREL